MANREKDLGRLGGGWVAAAVGLSEYASPLDAYLRITGEVEDERSGEAIDRGVFLEPALREWHAKKVGGTIVPSSTRRHPEVPWASYTPDGIVLVREPRRPETYLAEYKAPGDMAIAKYGEAGTDQVPRDVDVQVRWGLFVTDLPKADVAALIGGELRLFHIQREPDIEKAIFDRARFFMEEYVGRKKPPPATFSERDTEWVKKRWPRSDPGKHLLWTMLTAEQRALVDRYINSYLALDELEKRCQELENAVKQDVFGDASDITALDGDESAPFRRIDWKNNATAGPAWKKVAEGLRGGLVGALRQVGISEEKSAACVIGLWDALVKEHTPETPPRVFKPYFKRGQR
jgi:putative phage-type endonuclease